MTREDKESLIISLPLRCPSRHVFIYRDGIDMSLCEHGWVFRIEGWSTESTFSQCRLGHQSKYHSSYEQPLHVAHH